MQVLETKSPHELLSSLLAEVAKATNEIRCARGDIDKAATRLGFVIAVVNELIARKDQKEQR